VWEDLKPSDILTADAFDNAITVDMAIGGSTNAIIHLIAMAGRAGIKLPLDKFHEISQRTPVLANLRPSGEFLMEDFYDAGGLRALLYRMRGLLNQECLTVSGKTLGEDIAGAKVYNDRVILSLDQPLSKAGATFVLRGNLAPDGCVIKPTAADPELLQHTGPAVVFRNYADLKARLDDESLNITRFSVIVLQNAGPTGAPGIPEWGMLPIPKKLLKQGVRDMVRISDARMSGTSYGTCVLHVAPESAIGGPLALVQDDDLVELNVKARRLHLHVSDDVLARRKAAWKAPAPRYERGYGQLFCQQITQANEGCDFAFLHHGKPTAEPDIF
jgi:dihydroxy-acid dehydratase